MMNDPLNTPVPPSAASSPDPAPGGSATAAPGDHGPDEAPANPRDPSTFPRFPASAGPDLALPGPHPHDAADADRAAGDAFGPLAEPVDYTDPAPIPPPAGVTAALPGPHPHTAADVRDNGGLVAGWADPMAGFADDDDSGH